MQAKTKQSNVLADRTAVLRLVNKGRKGMTPKDFCVKWVPMFFQNKKGAPMFYGEWGYRKACIQLLSFVLRDVKDTTINTWGEDFHKAPQLYDQTLALTDVVWEFYFQVVNKGLVPRADLFATPLFREE